MKTCSQCNQTSPFNSTYCIMCGALFQANTDTTYKLEDTVEIGNKTVGPFIPYAGKIEYGNTYVPSALASGVRYPFTEPQKEEPVYYMYKAELYELLKKKFPDKLYININDITYQGRKIVFLD